MPAAEDVYRFIRREAPSFAKDLLAAAKTSHNEAELRTQVAHQIQQLADKLGVQVHLREEYTLAEGQADAVYNRLVIEYKAPGTLRATLGDTFTLAAVQQLRGYLDGLSPEQRRETDRLLGVVLDGSYLIFARYHQGHWNVDPPLAVTSTSAERFLRALFSLAAGRALIPENLIEDFGAQSAVSHEATTALYHALDGHEDDLTAKLFAQWQMFFSEVSGYDEESVRLLEKKGLRAFVTGMGLDPGTVDPPRLLFAIHTYFSFLVKAIARLVLERHVGGKLGARPLSGLANLPGPALRQGLSEMESGGMFRALGLQNLLEGDFFAWYLQAWDEPVEAALRAVLARLGEYNPSTIEDDPYAARDLLKKLYHYLLPRQMRHDLGEYYTPDWLAERVLTQINEPRFLMPEGDYGQGPNLRRLRRLLDPACGSGTFLVLAIRALKEHCRRQEMNEGETLEVILRSVVGIDLNPMAVLAARVNYLLAVADLLPWRKGPVEIPVYLADSILPPTKGEGMFEQRRHVLKTTVGNLPVPFCVDTSAKVDTLANLLHEYVHGRFEADVFVERACAELGIETDDLEATALRELFTTLDDLERREMDGVWARVVKNAFMPLFLEPFDYVVGNPPWVNWQSLPEGYRKDSAHLWQQYGLFMHKGMDAILGKGKKDLCTLMTYAVADRFLKPGGKLGFVITQSVFKTAGAGQGFRRFRIGSDGPHLRVLVVDDMTELQPFEGASNRTAVFTLRKGEPNRYPVPYTYWRKKPGFQLDYDSTLQEAQTNTSRLLLKAVPVDAGDPASAWLTAREGALRAIRKVLGTSDYEAHAGVSSGGANAVYWLEVLERRPDGLFVVRNVTHGARREAEQVVAEIESEIVHPLLRPRDVLRWRACPSAHLLVVQDPQSCSGIHENVMQRSYPKTYAYLKRFEDVLRQRKSQPVRRMMAKGPFYSMFPVGRYTFAPRKVVWSRLASRIHAVVVTQEVMPQETMTLVGCQSAEEAHYVCGVVNSSQFNLAAQSYSQIGGKSLGSPHILRNIRVPRFETDNTVHQSVAELSHRAHGLSAELAEAPSEERAAELRQVLAEVEAQVDEAAAELWGITPKELAEVQRNLEELA